MNEQQKIQLSAYLDGELSSSEQNKITDLLSTNAVLREQLSSFQRISDSIQADGTPQIDASHIASAVSQQLSDEPTILAPRARRPVNVPRIALGAALAATVAMVTVNVAPQLLSSDEKVYEPETFAFAPKLSTPNFSIATVSLQSNPGSQQVELQTEQRWKVLKPRVQNRLDRYLVEHNEYSGRTGIAGPSAQVGFVSTKNAR